MTNEKFKKLEKRAKEIFGEKAVLTVADAAVVGNYYMTRIKLQGMPFEISSVKETLEEAEELAIVEFEKHVNEALENKLFPTQPNEKYEVSKLTEQQFNKLFKFEDFISEEYTNELKEKTVTKICQLESGEYECVIESPYMCLNARARSMSKQFSIHFAIMVAHEIFIGNTIHVGIKLWKV